jgi:hypothetical protein
VCTGTIVRRWPTGKIAERPIRTKSVARIGLLSGQSQTKSIPPRMGGKFIIKSNEREQYPKPSDLD